MPTQSHTHTHLLHTCARPSGVAHSEFPHSHDVTPRGPILAELPLPVPPLPRCPGAVVGKRVLVRLLHGRMDGKLLREGFDKWKAQHALLSVAFDAVVRQDDLARELEVGHCTSRRLERL
jgi:hypothetical protein